MSLPEMFCYNFINITVIFSVNLWLSGWFLGQTIYRKRNRLKVIVPAIILTDLLISFVVTFSYQYNISDWKYPLGSFLHVYIIYLLGMCYRKILYHKKLSVCWITFIFLDMLQSLAQMIIFVFQPGFVYHMADPKERILYSVIISGLAPLLTILFGFLLKRLKTDKAFGLWIEHMDSHPVLFFLLSFSPILQHMAESFIHTHQLSTSADNRMVVVLFLLIIFIILNYTGREELQKLLLEEQKISMQQQNVYIENLENIQQEMKKFHHDFNNMMSGMYLSAKEGDLETISKFILDMSSDFNDQAGGQIRLLNQMKQIRIPELKGLLLTKINRMQKENIHCELEVIYPVSKLSMKTTDLCRCLGILLDNAIEEVLQKEDALIFIMISCQSEVTTFCVKNRLYSAVDTQNIWKNGFSTKGPDRGVGLSSYKKILERYHNIVSHTAVTDGFFLQEFKVQEHEM